MAEQATTPSPGGTGYLVVQVTTANSVIPLANAAVTISGDTKEGSDVIYELKSGEDGKTSVVSLPTPARAYSQGPLPEGAPKPYTGYNITISLPRYLSSVYQHVPIYDGITAIQQVNLIPVPENGFPDAYNKDGPRLYNSREPEL